MYLTFPIVRLNAYELDHLSLVSQEVANLSKENGLSVKPLKRFEFILALSRSAFLTILVHAL